MSEFYSYLVAMMNTILLWLFSVLLLLLLNLFKILLLSLRISLPLFL